MGKDIKQGDDDGMKNEYEGVHLAPAPEKSRGGSNSRGAPVGWLVSKPAQEHFCSAEQALCYPEICPIPKRGFRSARQSSDVAE